MLYQELPNPNVLLEYLTALLEYTDFCAKEYHVAQNFGSGKPRGGLLSKNILAAEILGDWTVQAAP